MNLEKLTLNELRLQISDCGGSLLTSMDTSLSSLRLALSADLIHCSGCTKLESKFSDSILVSGASLTSHSAATAMAVVFPTASPSPRSASEDDDMNISPLLVHFSFSCGFHVADHQRPLAPADRNGFESLSALLINRSGGSRVLLSAVMKRLAEKPVTDDDSNASRGFPIISDDDDVDDDNLGIYAGGTLLT